MKPHIRLPIALFMIVAAVGVACGSSAISPAQPKVEATTPAETSAPESSSGGIDACAVLLKSDAEAILGGPVGEAEQQPARGFTLVATSCAYRLQSDSAQKASVEIFVPADGSVQAAQKAFEDDKTISQTMVAATPVDIPNMGDSAYWIGGLGNVLNVLKGKVHLRLAVTTQTGETPPQPVLDLGQTLLTRLP